LDLSAIPNFGIVYDDVQGEARLAPAYDPVTTSVYLPQDRMALTLNGSTQWPDSKSLRRLGETRMGGAPARIGQIFERVADALSQAAGEIQAYMKEHAEFRDVGERMLREWEKARKQSLSGG
jgi:serine/threonine-protein kinase HipA